MSSEVAPTPESQASEAAGEQGSIDQAALAFAGKDDLPVEADEKSTTHDEDEPDDEPKDDANEEASDGEPEDAEAKDELVEVEFEGKSYEVPPELQKALLRQADYSRKMNEATAQEKTYTQRSEQAEKLIEGVDRYAQALAEVNGVDAQLKQYEKVDWTGLRQQNPAEYAALAADMQTLRLSREDAVKRAQGIDGEITQGRQTLFAEKRADMEKVLGKNLKGWGDELGAKITKYSVDSGVKAETLQALTDPALVVALDKARRYDALQKDKATIQAKAKDAPRVAKPGSPHRTDPKGEAMTRLKKSNSLDDAAAAFLSR